jgi:predicted DNA-binding ribbon-helix-helix protein
MKSAIIKRSIDLSGRKTSISLEEPGFGTVTSTG